MKKILGLTVAALIVIALVGAGTWAYFSDTESSADNSLTAGTLDLNWNGDNDTGVATFSETTKAPGDSGTGSKTLANAGSLSGELDVAISTITNTGGAGGTEFEGGDGELGGVALMVAYVDVDQSGTFNTGDIELNTTGANAWATTTNEELTYATVDSYDSVSWDAVQTMIASAADDFIVLWQIPTSAGNSIQGDSISFDVTFTLEQADVDS